jgi:hypothetical protein
VQMIINVKAKNITHINPMHIYVMQWLRTKTTSPKNTMCINMVNIEVPPFQKQNAYKHTSSWRLSMIEIISKTAKSCKHTNLLPKKNLMTTTKETWILLLLKKGT